MFKWIIFEFREEAKRQPITSVFDWIKQYILHLSGASTVIGALMTVFTKTILEMFGIYGEPTTLGYVLVFSGTIIGLVVLACIILFFTLLYLTNTRTYKAIRDAKGYKSTSTSDSHNVNDQKIRTVLAMVTFSYDPFDLMYKIKSHKNIDHIQYKKDGVIYVQYEKQLPVEVDAVQSSDEREIEILETNILNMKFRFVGNSSQHQKSHDSFDIIFEGHVPSSAISPPDVG